MKNSNKFIYSNIILTALLLTILAGCGTLENCEENQILGNMGNIVNTNLDEHSPSIIVLPLETKRKYKEIDTNDYLYFTATRYDQGNNESIYNVLLNDIEKGAEHVADPDFPLNDTTLFRNAGMPVFRYNQDLNKVDLFFAALPKLGRLSRDIYYSQKIYLQMNGLFLFNYL